MESFTAAESLIKEVASAELPATCTRWEQVGRYTYYTPRSDLVLLGYVLFDFVREQAINFAWERGDLDVYAEMHTDSYGEEDVDLRVAEIVLTREFFEEIIQG
jgi:hypothetical protein